MTAALVILAATNAAAFLALAYILLLPEVSDAAAAAHAAELKGRDEWIAATEAEAADQLRLAQRLVDELADARQREARANEIADERRVEAAELRAELERRAHADLVGERVVVTTIDGHAIEGDLERLYSDGYLLARAHYLQGDGPRELGGFITIREANESFIQRPGAPPPAAPEVEA